MVIESIAALIAAIAGLLGITRVWMHTLIKQANEDREKAERAANELQARVDKELAESKEVQKKLDIEVHELTIKMNDLLQKVAALEGGKRAIIEVNERLTVEIQAAREEVGSLKQQVTLLETQKLNIETERANLLNQAAEKSQMLYEENTRLTREIEELKQRVKGLDQQVNAATVLIAEQRGILDRTEELEGEAEPLSPVSTDAAESSEDTVPLPPEELTNSDSQNNDVPMAVNTVGE